MVCMFPASAGMNRICCAIKCVDGYVPRERGDEPTLVFLVLLQKRCSPRARG